MATFGNTSTSSADYASSVANFSGLAKGTLSESGDVNYVTWRTRTSSGTANAKGVIYNDSGGNPSTLVAVSNPTTITTTLAVYQLTFGTPVSLSPGDYWIGMITDGVIRNYYDTTGSYADDNGSNSYSSPVSPFPIGAVDVGAYESYADYTPAATGIASLRQLVGHGQGTR